MRKTIPVLLIFCFTVQLLCISSFAGSAQLSCTSVSGAPGETVSVTVSFSDNPGITSMKLQIEYDRTVLELLSVSDEELFDGFNFIPGKDITQNPQPLIWAGAENSVKSGALATVSFRILSGASVGDSQITVLCRQCFDEGEKAIPVVGCVGTVSVTPAPEIAAGFDPASRSVELEHIPEGVDVLAAIYENGKMITVKTGTVVNGRLHLSFYEESDGTEIKVFFLSSNNPFCSCETFLCP